jgi:hypothetical protein
MENGFQSTEHIIRRIPGFQSFQHFFEKWESDAFYDRPAYSFRAMLGGFHEIDEHFPTAPFERNSANGAARRLVQ